MQPIAYCVNTRSRSGSSRGVSRRLLRGSLSISGLCFVGGFVGGMLADRRRRLRTGGEFDVAFAAAFSGALLVLLTLQAGRGAASALGGLLATLATYALFPGLLSAMLSFVPAHRHGVTGAINTL